MSNFIARYSSGAYGSWPEGFSMDLSDTGYVALCGPNNSGKSTLLQLAFSSIHLASRRALLLPPERSLIVDHTNVSGSLDDALNNLHDFLKKSPIDTAQMAAEAGNDLSKYLCRLPNRLLNDQGLLSFNDLNDKLRSFKLPEVNLRGKGSQTIVMDGRPITQHGAGIRSLFTILTALIHPDYQVILIDEPEFALEPSVQKALRDLLHQFASNKLIVVATHSHLFLNRNEAEFSSNYRIVKNKDNESSVSPCASPMDLQDLTFNLLGNSLGDLFLPENYIVVEGASDQVIMKRTLQLLDPSKLVQVVGAGGITNVANKFSAVAQQVLPTIMNSSPYSKRVVALVDLPNVSSPGEIKSVAELNRYLTDRLFQLDKLSLEEYLPKELYLEAGLDKDLCLENIKTAQDKASSDSIKKEISEKISALLTLDKLDTITIIRDAAKKALELSG